MSLRVLASVLAAAPLAAPSADAATIDVVTGTPVVETVTDFPGFGVTGGILQITTTDATTTIAGIRDVNVIGLGGGLFRYGDLLSSPDPTGTATAIADAFFGLTGGTIAGTGKTALAPGQFDSGLYRLCHFA